MIRLLLSVFALVGLAFSLQSSDLSDFVTEYEGFNFHLSHVNKRSSDLFELNLKLDGQELTLLLQNNHELTRYLGDSLTSSRSFLKGTVQNHPDSVVRLSMEENFLEGLVILDGVSYYVENLETPTAEGFNTFTYKASNVKRDAQGSLKERCQQMEPIQIEQGSFAAWPAPAENEDVSSSVFKRETARDCRVAVIADITFSRKYGANTQSIMLSTINTIDGIYLKQLNVGLPVVSSYVVTSTTDSTGLGAPPNNIQTLLERLASLVNTRAIPNMGTNICVAHLFTYQDFGGTLGLAYVGSSRTNTIGGICSPQGLNTGVSSFLNFGRESSVIVRTVTVAHEIGHNFGSNHDTQHPNPPGNLPECNPTDKYMMFPSVNTGNNAQTFSTCSLYTIRETIRTKSSCFVTRPTTGPTSAPTTAPTSGPTSGPTTAPTIAPTLAPTRAPTLAPTQPPSSGGDYCLNDPRLGGQYVACPYQPSGFSPCTLFCATPGQTSQCFYFTASDGSTWNKMAGTSCGTSGQTCTSTGECVSPTAAPTRAPTLPPTTAPTSTAAPTFSPTLSPQPQCPSWAPTACSTNDCRLSCSFNGFCFTFSNRPDGTPCGGNGRCVAGTCRPSSAVETKECDPNDACCDPNGNLRPLGYVCRPAATLCDIEEVCDPDSSRPSLCPEDLVIPGGTPCNCSDSSDPSSCSSKCGSGDFLGVCGKSEIQSCTGKTCPSGTTCSILKGEATCVPDSTNSCQNNCGKSASMTVGCYCDESCLESGDCCDDYKDFCVVTREEVNKGLAGWAWGLIGAVIALVVVASLAALGFVLYKRSRKNRV